MRPDPIEHWHQLVASRDLRLLDDLLSEDAVFQSPAVHTPQVGKATVAKYLRAALKVLGNGNFRYTGEWFGPNSAVLEFETEIDGTFINGVDLIRWNAEGRIDNFKVMIRPFKALNLVISLMSRELQAG